MSPIEVKLPTFAYPVKDPEHPCACQDRPMELTYKKSQLFWSVEDGTQVVKDEPIADLEVEKKNLELVAPASGVLRHRVEQGATVNASDVLAVIEP